LALGLVAGSATAAPAEAPVALTVGDAVSSLNGLKPGEYKMVFVHPYTCCPVEVCFCLPCGCYDVKCGGCCATKLVFNYKGMKNDVVIKFTKDGCVAVKD
jgi:hypothetical protein